MNPALANQNPAHLPWSFYSSKSHGFSASAPRPPRSITSSVASQPSGCESPCTSSSVPFNGPVSAPEPPAWSPLPSSSLLPVSSTLWPVWRSRIWWAARPWVAEALHRWSFNVLGFELVFLPLYPLLGVFIPVYGTWRVWASGRNDKMLDAKSSKGPLGNLHWNAPWLCSLTVLYLYFPFSLCFSCETSSVEYWCPRFSIIKTPSFKLHWLECFHGQYAALVSKGNLEVELRYIHGCTPGQMRTSTRTRQQEAWVTTPQSFKCSNHMCMECSNVSKVSNSNFW